MSRATSFGSEAEAYEAARPGYPGEAAEFVLSLTDVSRAVEVGAGTGKTTEPFAREGVSITCLEPDPAMGAILRAKSLPGVAVVESTFEDWPGPEGAVDLVFAGQSWHWLDRETAVPRAGDWLRSDGVIALMWNVPSHRYDVFADVYRRHAPQLLREGDPRIGFRDSDVWLEDLERGGMTDVRLTVFRWHADLTPPQVRALYASYSDHIALDPQLRERLLDALAEKVATSGGTLRIEYETRVFTGLCR
ncbi:MAG TPA: class I SAM-dependent methyltransferase [Acidimicrobiia bacterium]